jgi:hypothetical protein
LASAPIAHFHDPELKPTYLGLSHTCRAARVLPDFMIWVHDPHIRRAMRPDHGTGLW